MYKEVDAKFFYPTVKSDSHELTLFPGVALRFDGFNGRKFRVQLTEIVEVPEVRVGQVWRYKGQTPTHSTDKAVILYIEGDAVYYGFAFKTKGRKNFETYCLTVDEFLDSFELVADTKEVEKW